jgi:hypothetical protein
MNSATPNQNRKTRRAKLHVRKTYKNNPRKQSSFLQIFNGLDVEAEDYKEVSEAGIHKIGKLFTKYLPLQRVPVQNRTFYDLGCGVGKIIVGMALIHPQLRSIGIELLDERAQQAGIALGRVSKHVQNRCGIMRGSVGDSNFSYGNACWIFVSNFFFSPELNNQVAQKLSQELPVGCVIQSVRPLEDIRLVLKEVNRVPVVDEGDAQLHVYVKE